MVVYTLNPSTSMVSLDYTRSSRYLGLHNRYTVSKMRSGKKKNNQETELLSIGKMGNKKVTSVNDT